MTKKIKRKLKPEDFSDKKLAGLFDRNLNRQINKLNKLHKTEEKFLKEIKVLTELLINNFKPMECKLLERKLRKNSPYNFSILRLQYAKKKKLNEFFKKTKKNICWENKCCHKVVQYGHILPRGYFNKRRKGVKRLVNFKDSLFNLIPLCSYHHDFFDGRRGKKNKLSSTNMKIIINKKRAFNKKLEKIVDKEQKYYDKAIKRFSRERKKLENYEKSVYNVLTEWKKYS